MPPRRGLPGPASELVKKCLELVAEGATLKKATDACSLNYSLVWSWICMGDGKEGYLKHQRPSAQTLASCKQFTEAYARACAQRDEKRLQDALESIRVAAQEGHAGSKITEESVPAKTERITTTRPGKDGHPVTTVTERVIPAHQRRVTEVEKERPDWRAAQVLLEKLAPDRYGARSNVHVSGDLRLEPGEADAVAAACTDDEARAIDRGDVKVLAQVLARVRAEKKNPA